MEFYFTFVQLQIDSAELAVLAEDVANFGDCHEGRNTRKINNAALLQLENAHGVVDGRGAGGFGLHALALVGSVADVSTVGNGAFLSVRRSLRMMRRYRTFGGAHFVIELGEVNAERTPFRGRLSKYFELIESTDTTHPHPPPPPPPHVLDRYIQLSK